MSAIEMSPEAKVLMKSQGWTSGFVAFGFSASESTVKLALAMTVTGMPVKWVTLSFSDAPLSGVEGVDPNFLTPGSIATMGVKSDAWKLLSAGKACMPALAIDGQLYMESEEIVKMLATQSAVAPEVMELIDLSRDSNASLLEAVKHWGWSALHASQSYAMVNAEHYISFGQGVKDAAWEMGKVAMIKAFLGKCEAVLAAKPSVNGFYVGDSLTLADACLINWPLSLSGVAGLDVAAEFPKVWANWEATKAAPPKGTEPFIFGFPMFCDYVAGANKAAREGGFDINSYFLKEKELKAYLDQFGVRDTLSKAVAAVLRDRPANPLLAIAESLKA